MKRLVYSPSVNAWVKTDTGVFDLSPYITDFQIDRRIGQVSSATVSFRNPRVTDERDPKRTRFLFTEHIGNDGSVRPMFHPMDPIIITLTRLKGRPIQVFTGYCDTTPYVQLLPGVASITASCTLKRLQYTYWDPALPFVREFMLANGWAVQDQGVAINYNVEEQNSTSTDGNIGSLLYKILKEIGGWNDKNIYIQGLPDNIKTIVSKLYKDTAKESASSIKEFDDFLNKTIGGSAYGGMAGQANVSGTSGSAGVSPVLPANAPALLKKFKEEADRINNHTTHYSQDYARSTQDHLTNPPKDGNGKYYFDCSSFVSHVLKYMGQYGLGYAEVSGWFANNWGAPGKGKYITVWANEGHVFFEYTANGKSSFIGTAGFVEHKYPDKQHGGHNHTVGWMDSYPTSGFTPRHIPGL
jgi:hypothetical protein